jgi:hypothetical protein
MTERLVTNATLLIALAVIVRGGNSVSSIIQQISKSTSMFTGVLLGSSQ